MKPTQEPEDEVLAELLDRAGRGDEAAFEQLYRLTSPRTFGLVLRVVRSSDLAEDVLVDVYDQIWHQASRFDRSRGTVRSWIGLVARTRSIDQLRGRARQQDFDGDPLQGEKALAVKDPTPDPMETAHCQENKERLLSALSRLPSEQYSVIMASFFGGLSHGQISNDFGQPLGTVKTRIRLGLATLRKALATADGRVA